MQSLVSKSLQIDFINLRPRLLPYPRQDPLLCARILEQSMWVRNRVGIGLSFRPARLHRLAESIPWNRFLGFLNI
jgi:hypothetical protein